MRALIDGGIVVLSPAELAESLVSGPGGGHWMVIDLRSENRLHCAYASSSSSSSSSSGGGDGQADAGGGGGGGFGFMGDFEENGEGQVSTPLPSLVCFGAR